MSNKRHPVLLALGGCGCLVGLLFLLLVGGVGYLGFQGVRFGQEIEQVYTRMAADYRQLEQAHPFAPPADGRMNAERLSEFLAIRSEMAAFQQAYEARLKQAGEAIDQQFKNQGFWAKLRGFQSLKEIVQLGARLFSEVSRRHRELLAEHRMSAAEYQWLTRTYLGTLAQADEHGNAPAATLWKSYLTRFEAARQATRHVQVNTGDLHLRGEEMNESRLLDLLRSVEYRPENAALVLRAADQLLPPGNVTLIDFLGAQLDAILRSFPAERSQPVPAGEATNPTATPGPE